MMMFFPYQAKNYDIMTKQKVNASAIISELRVARFSVLLCRIVAMSALCPALQTNILKLEGEFFNGYQDENRVFICL